MQISKEMIKAREDLLNLFIELRSNLKPEMTNEQLVNDDSFKSCYLINFLLTTIFSDELAYESAELLLIENNYDIKCLMDSYEIVFDNEINNFKISVKNGKSLE